MSLLTVAFGVASFISLIYAVWPNLTHKEIKHRKAAWVALSAFVIITIVLSVTQPTFNEQGLVSQTGTIEVSNRSSREFEVFYPQQFTSTPNLELTLIKGSGELEVIVQRKDGFKFKIKDIGFYSNVGAYVQWTAKGKVSDN